MNKIDYNLLRSEIARHPYQLLFATVSGAHLYGFPSPDSDYDLRGAHILPKEEALGLLPKRETLELSNVRNGIEIDYVTHDLLKFFNMLLKRNGYVLEQLYSPLIVSALPEHEELKVLARKCITRHHAHHYFGFADTQWALFSKEHPPRIKPLLYTYRVLLTGIHLMNTGEVEANLPQLNETAKLPFLPELIERKTSGSEHEMLGESERDFHQQEFQRWRVKLQTSAEACQLPDGPTAHAALNDLLVSLRLNNVV
jgi:uncharacterized protein